MRKGREIIRIIIMIFLIIIILYSGIKIGGYFYDSYTNKNLNEELRDSYRQTEKENLRKKGNVSENSITEERKRRFIRIKKLNDDVVGWVKVPGTKIDYPVVQANDNNYYLRRNVKEKRSLHGTVFMDYRNSNDMVDSNTLIYGHNMKDGSMFSDLSKYNDETFYREHPYIEYETPEKSTKWEIFSVYIYQPGEENFQVIYKSKKEFSAFIKECQNKSIYDTNIAVDDNDILLTLMTCSYKMKNARLVVHARSKNPT